jgi:LemA protein
LASQKKGCGRSPGINAAAEQEAALLKHLRTWSFAIGLAVALAGCDHDNILILRGQAEQAWGEVQAHDQQRVAAVLALVDAVHRRAQRESAVLEDVLAAREAVLAIQPADDFIVRPDEFRRYADAQEALSKALERLYATVERYPELAADRVVRARLSELRRIDDRALLARSDLIAVVRAHNKELWGFPDRMMTALLYPDARPLTAFVRSQAD